MHLESGGTAEDYAQHIIDTVDNIAETYTLTERCAANHAAVNGEWGKTLNELNCHLHPLDSIATAVRVSH